MAAAAAAPVRLRQYKRILTSKLHRKFVHASALSLLVCYLVAFFVGAKKSFFWSWFPLGACGLRTLLLFLSSMAVFVLRVGQMHTAARITSSRFASWKHAVFSFSAVQTVGWYLFSAWWFSEVYMWSSSEGADLSWVKPGRPYERAQLNERPIYLHCYYALLAVAQACFHLYFDWDQVPIPIAKRRKQNGNQKTHPLDPIPVRLRKSIPDVVYNAVLRSLAVAVAGPFIYMFFLRRHAWGWSLYLAKLFWNFPRSAADPPGVIPPLHISLLFRTVTSGTLLVVLWQASNVLFSTFLGEEPLKKGQPLSLESKDPNGSLINGLNAKRDIVKTYAFWELCLISQQFPDRRKIIFSDIDREGGAAWSQILKASTDVIKGITVRIAEFQNPTPAPPSTSESERKQDKVGTSDNQSSTQPLPRITAPPQEGNIFLASPKPSTRNEKFESTFGSVAKSYGQSPDWTPAARNKARGFIDRAATAVLSPEQKKRFSASAEELRLITSPHAAKGGQQGSSSLHPLIQQLLRSPLGIAFQQTYARRVRAIILGSPYGSLAPIIDATESLTRLLVASLTEDQFGKVQSDVASVVRLFTETITVLETFVSESGLDVHWTDVDFPDASASAEVRKKARGVTEVNIILSALKSGLGELLAAFRLYLNEVGLVGKDLRLAREAAGVIDEE